MPPDWWFLTMSMMLLVSVLPAVALGLLSIMQARRLRQVDQMLEQRCRSMADRLRAIEERLAPAPPDGAHPNRVPRPASTRGTSVRVHRSSPPGPGGTRPSGETTLITVPELASVPRDAEGSFNDLKDRHAMIWELAEKGTAPEVIARATGQPIGQVELILGLRRRIDADKLPAHREPS